MSSLRTRRLDLIPVTIDMVEAVIVGDRAQAEVLAGAPLPHAWPGRELVERAFGSPLDRLRKDPGAYLWGARLMIRREERAVIGSIVLNGRPDPTGTVEIGYGVEERSQGLGYATEGATATLRWAFTQPGVSRVTATTFPWHKPSLGVIRKLGMHPTGSADHPLLGELLVFEVKRPADVTSISHHLVDHDEFLSSLTQN